MADDWLLEQYDDYLENFEAWGHEFLDRPLSFGKWEDLWLEQEEIDLAQEFGHLTEEHKRRREEIQRLMLTHASYFVDGPRVVITYGKDSARCKR